MDELIFPVLLAHFAGDYWLQTKNMALNKSKKGVRGILTCCLHSLVYTACFCAFLRTPDPWLAVLIFLSHYPLDRWSLAEKWLKLINGRNVMGAFLSRDKYREIDLSFSCIVYAVTDNSMHLFLIWLIIKFISF
ncbi:hypothetical protein A2303_00550 [Candidatus Falkowbacteria bacterium RIFOXYB2_FULL_47_14]|uniref:DUF3307 domain-containing protein n=1 Tax=Candidatus Falkowbacteria bacterium RIFOXYA2_FULL_47_19 TaxID=1797994 RepID=A0A1F5SLY4_9BACT|nr:MAG: hypothetical protein A2227_03955 [Candidatus Falkowbacteria bacterium RIFOXYA2_FULL_47_19]OGF34704.1 MAG: hypothetical protein A2468_02500 [Candidatus Falkowbacteria bacterium RIFOXYC2_FULL_46_15]OGF42862.1 MAG: hypothetical protein A2303_00550 [Candidatus Falkowbacteria bacterium RIFOXYB2_FULL_47_14]